MHIEFQAKVIFWHGPAPFLFAPVPADISKTIKELSAQLSYGWGCIPVMVRLGKTEWKTSLMPREGVYLVPMKMAVQKSEDLAAGSLVNLAISLGF